ncbi:MAG: hypothetical protein HC888_19505, partial [Candidatus Competibacteraceae bacterium]|nr:hypothetical protein [Candidatus Competibacteraceae bacterium]
SARPMTSHGSKRTSKTYPKGLFAGTAEQMKRQIMEEAAQREEIAGSKEQLEAALGHAVSAFAIPMGPRRTTPR